MGCDWVERLGEELTLAIRWARYYGRLGEIGMGDLYQRFCMGEIGGRLLWEIYMRDFVWEICLGGLYARFV